MKKFAVLFLVLLFQCSFPYTLSADSTIKVGVYNNEPLIFIDADGKVKGIFADVIEYVPGTWQECRARLENKQIDILCTMAFSKARDKLYDFNKENLLTNWGQLYIPERSDIKEITDVAGKKVAALKGDIHYTIFTRVIGRFGVECEFVEADDYNSVLSLVADNKADAGIVSRFFGMKYGMKYKLDKSGVIFNPIKIHYAVPEGENIELIDTIDRYLTSLKKDENSAYYTSLHRWLEAVSAKWAFPQWGKWAISVTLGLIIVLFLGNLILGRRINAKTKELTIELRHRKKIEKLLWESEEKYRGLVQFVSDLVMTVDQNGNFTYLNPEFESLTAYPVRDFIGHSFTEILAPEFIESTLDRFKRGLSGEIIPRYEVAFKHKEGKTVPVELKITSLLDADGKAIGRIGIARDITERKQAREKNSDNLQQIEMINANIPNIIWKTDIDEQGNFINMYISEVVDEFLALPPGTINNDWEKFFSYMELKYMPVINEKFQQGIANPGTLISFDYEMKKADGKIAWFSSKGRVRLENNKTTAFGSTIDITERRQAEKLLRESEEKFRSMMEAMKEPVYICSPDYRVEYMNPTMIQRTGRDAAGELCFKALHDLDKKCPWCMRDKTRADEYVELDIVSPMDNRSYHLSQTPIVHGDGSISKMSIFRDTTDLAKMEAQLRQAQKMEAIGTLAGGIAHDFNNILFGIFGYLEMALGDSPEGSPLRGHLKEVFKGAERAGDLVKQILAFSRRSEHEFKSVKTQLVIKDALKLIKSSLPSTIEISRYIRKDCGSVLADPTQIHQIVMNLCTNAYHAMQETGGKLKITLKEVELTVEDVEDSAVVPGPHVCLTVADTGPGMDHGVMARIFDPYFTTKEEGKGTGLGLAVVHGIVKSHGGHISVYSEPGKGTEFHVYLPVIKKESAPDKIAADSPIQKGTERILLVDDEDVIVQMGRLMLERLGYHVTARTGSIDTLALFRTHPDEFDLVITDMTMPNMTGDKLATKLIKIRPDIPIILCTGFSELMSKEKAAALGIKGFLMKPMVMKDFSNVIRKVLDGGK
ncbi:MAG: PAS domain S-box protein [Deltaproteobacteria bacterium]|nr:PAS domain S-box protein [Deltaproteobacteria bacterium]